ncbi:hypothetical protein AWB73_06483 [Caballeronia turbans]|nr:hypothetical protein AWB73_06483 [Caballeronia turbans]
MVRAAINAAPNAVKAIHTGCQCMSAKKSELNAKIAQYPMLASAAPTPGSQTALRMTLKEACCP